MNSNQIKEKCPNCQTEHVLGDYKEYTEAGQTISARPDVQCKCDLVLRPVVPIFKLSASGTVLKIKPAKHQNRK